MTLQKVRTQFKKSLGDFYSPEELNVLFDELAAHYFGTSRAELHWQPKRVINAADQDYFEGAIRRLMANEPLQYITGSTEFYGLPLRVNSNVLIPRPETEELVELILSETKDRSESPLSVLDIGTGSGCMAIALAANRRSWEVHALDISEPALEVARLNAEANIVKVNFHQADLLTLEALPQNFDLIVSNPPYVRQQERGKMHPNVLHHEPHQALFVSDEDPLIFYNRICALADKSLNQGGRLFFEINEYLGGETADLVSHHGFNQVEVRKDFLGKDRFLTAVKNE